MNTEVNEAKRKWNTEKYKKVALPQVRGVLDRICSGGYPFGPKNLFVDLDKDEFPDFTEAQVIIQALQRLIDDYRQNGSITEKVNLEGYYLSFEIVSRPTSANPNGCTVSFTFNPKNVI